MSEEFMVGRKKIIIIGARHDGHAGVIVNAVNAIGGYEIIGFIDNTPELQNQSVLSIPIISSTDDFEHYDFPVDAVHIAIGNNVARGKIFHQLKNRGIKVVTIIHPQAYVSDQATIGEGCYIGPKAVVNNGAIIGEACIINSGAIVEHDNKIGFSAHIAPGTKMAGRVEVGEYSFIGIGSTIIEDIKIGAGVMIGAGSTIVKHVPANVTMMGYAAKKYKKNIYCSVEPDNEIGAKKVYVAQPTLPDYDRVQAIFQRIYQHRILSNFAEYSCQLEQETQQKLSVKKALTFPSATSALMLIPRAMGLTGEVILPSFTFCATGHAVVWNNLTPVFADINPQTFNIDPDDVERKITPKTSAIIAVHIFGNPCDISRLEAIARKHKLKLIFDSAHALGSRYNNKAIGGFGDAECFSLSGTKIMTSAEGGLVTSNNEELMSKIGLGRNYGAASDYNCQYIGLNGKMSEFHAALAIEGLALLEELVEARSNLVDLYRKRLSEIPGISFQHVSAEHVSTYKDFAILIDKDRFGMDRDQLIAQLNKENIYPKKYFYPPLHQMTAYQAVSHRAEGLLNTTFVANNIVCLPIYSHMSFDVLEKICYAVYRIWKNNSSK